MFNKFIYFYIYCIAAKILHIQYRYNNYPLNDSFIATRNHDISSLDEFVTFSDKELVSERLSSATKSFGVNPFFTLGAKHAYDIDAKHTRNTPTKNLGVSTHSFR